MKIRKYQESDWPRLWPIMASVFRTGDSYPQPPDTDQATAHHYWVETPMATFVAEEPAERLLGSYYIRPNQPGLGSHVCNCGFMVAESARGQGLGTLLGEHAQRTAIELGFRAMQFNLVVATNQASIALWHKLGFEIIGRLPGAFRRPDSGYVDAIVMYKQLQEIPS